MTPRIRRPHNPQPMRRSELIHSHNDRGTVGNADSRSADIARQAPASPPPPRHRCAKALLLPQDRSGDPHQRARSPDRHAALVKVRDLSATHGRAYHFFCSTAFITSISRSLAAPTRHTSLRRFPCAVRIGKRAANSRQRPIRRAAFVRRTE